MIHDLNKIASLRKQQDKINGQIAKLLLQRLILSRKILKIKKRNGCKIRDLAREKEIISKVSSKMNSQITSSQEKIERKKYLSKIFKFIFQQTVEAKI